MKRPNYKLFFKAWEIGIAINVVNEFKNQWKSMQGEDYEDLLQECLIQWVFAKDSYKPDCGVSIRTFMARIVRNRLQNIVREHKSNSHKVSQSSISLYEPISEKESASIPLDVLQDPTDYQISSILRITLSQTISKLTPRQQELCELLISGESDMAEIGRIMNIDRATVYREIGRIRDVFEMEGLKDFLK